MIFIIRTGAVVQVQTECAEVQVHVQEITDCTGKVRPRTSAWYQLHVEATRRNLILPDLPVPRYYGLRPTRTVVRFVLLLQSIVS
jgi:hypothetical protein